MNIVIGNDAIYEYFFVPQFSLFEIGIGLLLFYAGYHVLGLAIAWYKQRKQTRIPLPAFELESESVDVVTGELDPHES